MYLLDIKLSNICLHKAFIIYWISARIRIVNCLFNLIVTHSLGLMKDSSSYTVGLLSSGLNHCGMWFCYWQQVSDPDWTHKRWARLVWLSPQRCCASLHDISYHLFHRHPVGVTSSPWPSRFRAQTNVTGLDSSIAPRPCQRHSKAGITLGLHIRFI